MLRDPPVMILAGNYSWAPRVSDLIVFLQPSAGFSRNPLFQHHSDIHVRTYVGSEMRSLAPMTEAPRRSEEPLLLLNDVFLFLVVSYSKGGSPRKTSSRCA